MSFWRLVVPSTFPFIHLPVCVCPCLWSQYPQVCIRLFVVCVARLRVPVGCTTELNHLGHQFLQRLFDKYDEVRRRPPKSQVDWKKEIRIYIKLNKHLNIVFIYEETFQESLLPLINNLYSAFELFSIRTLPFGSTDVGETKTLTCASLFHAPG